MTEPIIPPQRSFLATIFISPSEPRLRAGWRLLIQTILLIILSARSRTRFFFHIHHLFYFLPAC